jgi:uncharacterized protein YjiS (DUF1127 family)
MIIDLATCAHCFAALRFAISHWVDRARERRALAAMDDRALRDLGLSRYDVSAAIARSRVRP